MAGLYDLIKPQFGNSSSIDIYCELISYATSEVANYIFGGKLI
jgi:hypothetical protein